MTRFRKIALTLAFVLTGILTNSMAQEFVHPGVFNRESDYARMRQKIAEKAEPWYTAWNNLLASAEAQLGWSSHATATVIRGGTGDNIVLMYRDVASMYQHALIYKISGDVSHAAKAVELLNSWSAVNKSVSGNADRYLAAGLNGYQLANAAEMMRGYPGFDVERFKTYLLNVFYFPMNERFLLSNEWGSAHNDACATNYRVNWDICNMNAMMAISIFCDYKVGYDKVLNYFKNGDGTGNIYRAVNFVHSPLWGQWEESGRDQGHATGGVSLYGLFCEIAWNQGTDLYGYNDFRFRKGAEYVARYNIMTKDTAGTTIGKYEDLPYTSYSRQMGSNCSWYTESVLGSSVRGKYGSSWELIYNHYARRLGQGDKVRSIQEILLQQPSTIVPSVNIHPDTYDTPGLGALTFRTDSGSLLLPWSNMDINARSITKLPVYGNANLKDSLLTLQGAGSGIKGSSDQCQYVFRKLVDQGSLQVRITTLDELNTLVQAGVMVRNNLEQTAAFALLTWSAAQGVRFTTRDSIGKTANASVGPTGLVLPCWLNVSRNRDTIRASVSQDGVNWTTAGSKVLKLNRLAYIGMAVSSNNPEKLVTAVFDKINYVQGDARPIVTMSSPKSTGIAYVTPANVTVTGIAYDPEGAFDRTDIYLNNQMVSSTKASSVNYTVSGLKEGNYAIHLKSYDKSGNLESSDTIGITVSPLSTKTPWYKFDEAKAGVMTPDSSGNFMWSTLTGSPTIVAGKIGNALQFDGVDDYVRMPTTFIQKLSEFSVSLWVNPTAVTSWARLFDFGQDTNNYMMLTISNGSGLTFEIRTSNATQTITTGRILPLATWSHLAVTLSDNTLTIYLNGLVIGKSTSVTLRPYNLGTVVSSNFLGKSLFSADPYFSGKMDEVRFYNYALSPAEINAQVLQTGLKTVRDKEPLFQPNPATNNLHFRNEPGNRLVIYNTMGNNVLEKQLDSPDETIEIAHLPSGFYVVRLGTPENTFRQQILLKQ
jgi:hypothetical protein